jgi:deoxyribonuclease-4
MSGKRLGIHLATGPGLIKAAERAIEIGAAGLQLFTGNPTGWKRPAGPPATVEAFRARYAELGLGPLSIHGAYLSNLASPDPAIRAKSLELLAWELTVAPAYGAFALNVHIGSHRGAGVEAGIANVVAMIVALFARVPDNGVKLVLENGAGAGDGIGNSLEQLTAIAAGLAAAGVPAHRVGFCLDTAHLQGAGIALVDDEGVERLLARVDAELGLERLAMLHFNDSDVELGSRRDYHEHLGIGKVGSRALSALLRDPRLAAVPFYLETPTDEGLDAANVERGGLLAAGELVLPPLANRVKGQH